MTMTEPREGSLDPDRDDLTDQVSSAPEDATPPPSGTTPPAPGHYLARLGVPAVPHGWAPPKSKRAHRRKRSSSTWALVALLCAIACGSLVVVVWSLAAEAAPPQLGPPPEAPPANIPRLEAALGRPADPPASVQLEDAGARVALFDIPALDIHTTLADGVDPGTGPVLWPGTPWPGGPGRAVVALWADLSTLRPGHEVLVGGQGGYDVWRVATVRQVAKDGWAEVARQGIVSELALVEAADMDGRTTRTLVIAWLVK